MDAIEKMRLKAQRSKCIAAKDQYELTIAERERDILRMKENMQQQDVLVKEIDGKLAGKE